MQNPVFGYGGHGGPPGGGYPPGAPPGGYGPPGAPPGGYGPPGAPPGGYGGPPPGAPPGGYGGPPGAPPGGYGPPQGYGAPQPGYPPQGPGPGATTSKKTNPLIWVGVGCGGLFLLSAIGGGIAWYFTMRAASSAIEQIASAIPVAPAGSAVSPAEASATCAKAIACCKAITQKSGANPQAAQGCEAIAQLGDANCAKYHQTYVQSAKVLGVVCE